MKDFCQVLKMERSDFGPGAIYGMKECGAEISLLVKVEKPTGTKATVNL